MSTEIQVPERFQYLRPRQMEELERERNSLDTQIRSPIQHGADRNNMARRKRQIDRMLDEQSPPDLSATERDAYAKEARQLEKQFTEGMLSGEEMRRNPPGAVDRNLAWHKRNRFKVARWKNLMRALHRGDDSPNIANIERFRPLRTAHDLSMEGAQIQGAIYSGTHPSEAYKDGWERTFGEDPESAPEKKIAKPAKQTTKKPKKPPTLVDAACGKPVQRVSAHERWCRACQAIVAQRTEEPSRPAQ